MAQASGQAGPGVHLLMIKKFRMDTCLLMIDVQNGVDDLQYWGGENGRRNNPDAETNIKTLLTAWRAAGLPVFYTAHDSREAHSPLRLTEPGGAFKTGLEPCDGESVFKKDVNSGFIGTNLDIALRRAGVRRLVVVGFFTNMCIATTVRMAGNMGYDTYLVDNACACTNRVGPNGTDYDAELIHDTSIANLNGEFCTAIRTGAALALLENNNERLERVQGNE
jgi:nicotinamidase-related amidase